MIPFPAVILAMPESNDRSFLDRLIFRNRRLMLHMARENICDPAGIEDVISISCMSLMKAIPLLREKSESEIRAYIATTVKNTALNYNRSHSREKTVPLEPYMEARLSTPSDVDRRLLLEETLNEVLKIISGLPEAMRTVMEMKFRLEMSNAEIARQLGISENTVRQHIHRARERIRAQMRDE